MKLEQAMIILRRMSQLRFSIVLITNDLHIFVFIFNVGYLFGDSLKSSDYYWPVTRGTWPVARPL